jgi:hypothetical protein
MKYLYAAAAMSLIVALAFGQNRQASTAVPSPFTVVETGIPQLQAALKSGKVKSRDLVIQYLTRIAMYGWPPPHSSPCSSAEFSVKVARSASVESRIAAKFF